MTDAMMNLRTLVEKTPDADILREMIGFAAIGSAYECRSDAHRLAPAVAADAHGPMAATYTR